MYYLVDTNVFLHVIDSNIYGVAKWCKDNGKDITITQTILDELDPGYYRENEDESSKEIYTAVKNYVSGAMGVKIIKLVSLADIHGAEEEYKKIRKRFYSWMRDAAYLQNLISKGKLTPEEVKKPSFKTKDMGECELIAIAKASEGKYWVVTNDKGRVYKHPNLNIFDTYADDDAVTIISGEDLLDTIRDLSDIEQNTESD